MPENTIYVGRATKFGNPFIIGKDGTREECLESYKEYMEELIIVDFDVNNLIINKMKPRWIVLGVPELKGHNLMCFCKEELPCHADLLLKLANL
jgi:hypothetical protein